MLLNCLQTLSIRFGVLFVLLISPTALGQQPDSALSESQFEKILEKMDESEKEMRAYIDQKFDKLDTKIDEKFGELNAKFHELDKRVDRIDLKVNILIGILTIIGGPILVQILIHAVQTRLNSRKNSEESTEIGTENTENRDESDEGYIQGILSRDSEPSESKPV